MPYQFKYYCLGSPEGAGAGVALGAAAAGAVVVAGAGVVLVASAAGAVGAAGAGVTCNFSIKPVFPALAATTVNTSEVVINTAAAPYVSRLRSWLAPDAPNTPDELPPPKAAPTPPALPA